MRSGDLVVSETGQQWIIGFVVSLTGISDLPDGVYLYCVRDEDTPTGPGIIYALFAVTAVREWAAVEFERGEVLPLGRGMAYVQNDDHPLVTILQLLDGTYTTCWRWELEMAAMRGGDRPISFNRIPMREALAEEI